MLPGVRPSMRLGLGAHGGNALRAAGAAILADGHHRGFVQHDALAADVDQGVGGAQIDGEIVGEETEQAF